MSLLNYVPFMPTYLTCYRALLAYVRTCLKLLCPYVPTCLELLLAYVPSFFTCLRAYVLMCLYILFVPLCLCELIFHVLTFLKPLISILCNKASHQLNAIGRIQKYISFKEKGVFLITFGHFKYYPFV